MDVIEMQIAMGIEYSVLAEFVREIVVDSQRKSSP